jgi:hypothetical protein
VSCSARRWVIGASGVEVGFGSFSADAKRVACFLQCRDLGASGGSELVERLLVVGADAGGFLRCCGAVLPGAGDGGGFALAGAVGVLLGLLAVGPCGVALFLGIAAALDLLGETCFCGGDALVGAGMCGRRMPR